jgi:hypothetical protein
MSLPMQCSGRPCEDDHGDEADRPRWAKAISATIGTSSATRNSFTMAAVSPASRHVEALSVTGTG